MNILTYILIALSGILSQSIETVDGSTVHLSSYSGKKLLLVNLATGSADKSQIAGLQQLQQQYGSKVQVIGFGSNSFGNEPKNNAQLLSYYTDSVQVSFPVAKLGNVTGSNKHAVYEWLAGTGNNINITKDFQKILIDASGQVSGLFSSKVQPTDSLITNAINL